jgi:hypothetical protein
MNTIVIQKLEVSWIFSLFSEIEILVESIQEDKNDTESHDPAHDDSITAFSHRDFLNEKIKLGKTSGEVQHARRNSVEHCALVP